MAQEDEQEDGLGLEQTAATSEEAVEAAAVEVSLNSVVGLTTPKTMKMMGKIKGHEVIVMLNPGATHNFISLRTVQKL